MAPHTLNILATSYNLFKFPSRFFIFIILGLTPPVRIAMGPGPGSYKPLESMGRQSLSTKREAVGNCFSQAPR